jgi:hypothetical protein
MARLKKTRSAASHTAPGDHVPPVLDWDVSETFTANGRHLEPGTEVSIRGESGRFRFVRHVRRPNGVEWLDFIGTDSKGHSAGWRSFRPSRVRTVHRLAKTRANAHLAAA